MQKLSQILPVKSICTGVDSAASNNPVYIVETYRNGTQWYRKYSDGVIEQGGVIDGLTLNKETSYSFVVPFSNDNTVTMHLTNIFSDTAEANYRGGLSVSTVTTTGFTVFADGFTRYASTAYWEARGV